MINRTYKEYNDSYIVDLLDTLNKYVGLIIFECILNIMVLRNGL